MSSFAYSSGTIHLLDVKHLLKYHAESGPLGEEAKPDDNLIKHDFALAGA